MNIKVAEMLDKNINSGIVVNIFNDIEFEMEADDVGYSGKKVLITFENTPIDDPVVYELENYLSNCAKSGLVIASPSYKVGDQIVKQNFIYIHGTTFNTVFGGAGVMTLGLAYSNDGTNTKVSLEMGTYPINS